MPKTKTTSPARSQGGITTPKRKTTRGSRSLCSPALSTASGRLTSLVDQFKDKNMESFALSPLNGRSVLNDNTEIEEPKRKSWWKKLDENSQDVMEVLEDNKLTVDNAHEELDLELLSQEKKNYTLDLPESSDNESIHSIVLPQRRLFVQKENQPQKKYGHLIDNRESLAKLHKTNTANIDKTVNVGTRELFQNAKRSKPIFPAALLNISPNKTAADKTRENALADPKPQVRSIFGNRPANKRKNMFADFIVSESEDEVIPDIQPKVFGFHKKLEQRRISSISRGRDASPASSITTDIEMDFRMLLPSSTMVENQLEENMLEANTPIKRARLSKLSEAKESEAGTQQTNTFSDKTKQSNKSVASKDKSKASPEIKDRSLNSSRTTRSMLKNASKHEENMNISMKQDAKSNKSKIIISSKENKLDTSPSNSEIDKRSEELNKYQNQNKSRTRNSSKAIENEAESEENVGNVRNAINNETRVINKSTNKSLPNTSTTNKSVNEKERTVTIKVHEKVDKTNSNDVEQNEQEDSENNFVLEYENDDNEVIQEAEIENQKDSTKKNNTVVLEKKNRETEINQSKSINKSLQKIQKPVKTVEESVESQTEQYSADDNVDGKQDQEIEIAQNQQSRDEELVSQEYDEGANNSGEDMEQVNENEVNVRKENEEKENESENNLDEVNVSNKNTEKINESQEKVANESQVAENEENESEAEDEEDNKSREVETEANESQEIEEEDNGSREIEKKTNESQEIEEEENENQEIEEEENENQETEEEANESQEIEENTHESQIVDDDDAHDEEMNEDEEGAANESQVNEASANESQEVENDEEESHEVENDEEESHEVENDEEESREVENDEEESHEVDNVEEDSHEVENDEEESREVENDEEESHEVDNVEEDSHEVENDEEDSHEVACEAESDGIEDQQMDESDEADKAIATDPEISEQDDNNADEMEVDDDEQESDETEQNEHESHEERQIEEQNEREPNEEIEESPNVTHDTTGRYRKKDLNKSPEVILHDKTNQMDSFTAKGRNTSVRKTKSMIKNLNIRPSLAPPRDSTGFSDGTKNSSAEGSGWDSHRTTRKTLRQTFGKDFTPRKSLRALVMEKSAKRQTEHMEMHSESVKFPLANSTEMPEDSNHHVEDIVESDHEVSRRTRQTTLEKYLQKIKEQNIEKKLKMEAAVRNSLKNPVSNSLSLFKVPNKPAPRRPKPTQTKPKKQLKTIIPFDELPSEVIEDMKYKPPKRFQPSNASWITKRLYKYLENKLESKYDYKARVRAEKLVETIYHFAKDLRRHDVAPTDAVDVLKHELARLEVVRTHFEFYEFFHEFMPREVRVKVVPDIVNKIALPRHGVFSDILRGNTVQG